MLRYYFFCCTRVPSEYDILCLPFASFGIFLAQSLLVSVPQFQLVGSSFSQASAGELTRAFPLPFPSKSSGEFLAIFVISSLCDSGFSVFQGGYTRPNPHPLYHLDRKGTCFVYLQLKKDTSFTRLIILP